MIIRMFVLTLFFANLPSIAQTQTSVEKRLSDLLQYCALEVPEDSLREWTRLVQIGESEAAALPERNAAWEQFLQSLYQSLGCLPSDHLNPQVLSAWAPLLTYPYLHGRIFDLSQAKENKAPESILQFSGRGQRNLLLIPPLGFSNLPFDVFKKRYEHQFRFWELAYPAAATAYPYPEKAAYAEAAWLEEVEVQMANFIAQRPGEDLYIMALGNGLYTGLRLGLKFPTQVKGIISIDGQYRAELIDPQRQLPATWEYRQQAAAHSFPLSMVIQFAPALLANNYALSQDPDKNQRYLADLNSQRVNSIFRYNQEFKAQDIRRSLANFQVPILSYISEQDDQSPLASNRSVWRTWQEWTLQFPDHPLSILPIPQSRSLFFIDQPDLFDSYFQRFMADPLTKIAPFPKQNKIRVEVPSPAARVIQVLASTQLDLQYSRPLRRGRDIFGTLVPYGQLWRAGANAATRFETSNDVLIEGQLLPAGKYSLFFIPGKNQWELVFNKIAEQWGAFRYNPRYDALRLPLPVAELELPVEALTYSFEGFSGEKIDLVFRWERVEVRMEIKEHFVLPKAPAAMEHWDWQFLLSDKKGDGQNPRMTDGKALSYLQRGDSIWFKFDLHSYNNSKAFALNLLFDIDNDSGTGANWFGTNTAFVFDRAFTLWMQKSGNGFAGVHGMMLPEDFTRSNRPSSIRNNSKYYLDQSKMQYIVGFPIRDLAASSNQIKVIGAGGEFQTWNDDIGDQQSAIIYLK